MTDDKTEGKQEKTARTATSIRRSPTGLIGKAWCTAVGAFDLIGERIDGLYQRGKSKAAAKTTPKKSRSPKG